LRRNRSPLRYDFRGARQGASKGSERMMCGQTMQTMQTITLLTRPRAASRFLQTVGVVGAFDL
jgi:hypothetical protein